MKNTQRILLIVFTFLISLSYAKDFRFNLEKHQEAIRTFSGDIDQGASIHLIIFKDKDLKNYGIKPFFVDKNDVLTELNIISYPNEPSILSYHLKSNILSLIIKTSQKVEKAINKISKKPGATNAILRKKLHTVFIVDINLEDKKTASKKLVDNKPNIEQNYYRLTDKTLSIVMENQSLIIKNIENSNVVDSLSIQFKKEDSELVKKLFPAQFQFVDTNEYVKNGSISNAKFYYENETLYYTKFNEKEEELITAIIYIDKKKSPIIKQVELKEEYTVQWATMATYMFNENLFIFCRNPSNMYLDIVSLGTGTSVYRVNLEKELSKNLDLKKLKSLKSKLSNSINKPTITVNKTKDNNMLVRFDYVKIQNYYYHHDHFFWMQQQMMFQNQMNFTPPSPFRPGGFGPSNPIKDFGNMFFMPKKKELSQEIVLSPSYEIVENGTTETIKPKIEKGKFIALMNKIRAAKFLTSAFSDRFIRYIFYSKTFDGFVLKTSSYPK